MYTLYYSPGACSMAPHVVINEIGAKVELKKIALMEGEGQKPEYLKINPRGQVPVLVDDGQIITEGAAILIHLMEKNNSPLLPKSGKERTKALEWLCFANSSMHPAYSKAFWAMRAFSSETAKDEALHSTFQQINKLWSHVDAQLAKSTYVCGENITAADILLTVIANWNSYFPPNKVTLGNHVKRLIKEVSQRPAYQKALKEEQVEYKAAA